MKFTYDPRYNIAYIRFRNKQNQQVETIKVSEELNIDLSADGKIYGIELLNANEQIKRGDMAKFIVVNESTGEQSEIPLTV